MDILDYREIIEYSDECIYRTGYIIDSSGNMIKIVESKLPN